MFYELFIKTVVILACSKTRHKKTPSFPSLSFRIKDHAIAEKKYFSKENIVQTYENEKNIAISKLHCLLKC